MRCFFRPAARCKFFKVILVQALLITSAVPLSLAAMGTPPKTDASRTAEFLSPVYRIDRIYKSMEGPSEIQSIQLLKTEVPELLWITGYRVEIVETDGQTPAPREFMCHNNLDINPQSHGKIFGWQKRGNPRLFTLSQGQFAVAFPKGFGVPVMSDESFKLATQVLNHNFPHINRQIRHKISIDFIRDRDLTRPMVPLYQTAASVKALLEGKDGYWGVDIPSEVQKQASCLPGEHAPQAGSRSLFEDAYGRKFTGHWVVQPGREERRTLITNYLEIPFDTTVHFIAVHVHPFSVSTELRDLTTGKTIFKAKAQAPRKGIGLEHVDYYSSAVGIPVFKDHDYEIISRYNNTSGVNQDAMVSVFLYLEDKEFHKPLFTANSR